jgi:DinB family protein
MTGLPSDLQQVMDELDATDRAADTLVADLDDEQLHWQPDGGAAWSIAQCLEHLATINVVYTTPIRAAVDSARARGSKRRDPSRPGFFGLWFIRSMEPPVKRRLRSPGSARPGSGLPRDEVLRRYHDANAVARRLIHDAAAIDVNGTTFKNPFIPLIWVRVATGFRVITAHNRRHLWQAERVRSRSEFPGRSALSASDATPR